jgi:hypothetical protein
MTDKKLNSTEVALPAYEVPTITTFTDEDILEELGPAQANEYEIEDGVW